MVREIVRVLGKSRALDILLALSEKDYSFRELVKKVGGSTVTVQKRVEELKKLGLIQDRKLNKFPFTRTISITKKGKNIVEILKSIEGREFHYFIDGCTIKCYRCGEKLLVCPVLTVINGKPYVIALTTLVSTDKLTEYEFVSIEDDTYMKPLSEIIDEFVKKHFKVKT